MSEAKVLAFSVLLELRAAEVAHIKIEFYKMEKTSAVSAVNTSSNKNVMIYFIRTGAGCAPHLIAYDLNEA